MLDNLAQWGYVGMFTAAFLAATILPLGSEFVLSALLLSGANEWLLVFVASLGNVLGAMVNYALGAWSIKWLSGHREKIEKQIQNAIDHYRKYGVWALCLAWVPVIGDPITIAAGALRVNITMFIVLVSVGKVARYIALAQLVNF